MKIPFLTKKIDQLRALKNGAIDSYLSLMEKCLTGVIYEDAPLQALGQKTYDPQLREYGWDWPSKSP